MKRDVWVRIKGNQSMQQTAEDETQITAGGSYFYRDGTHYVKYEETHGADGVTDSLLKVRGDCVEVIKRGLVNTQMRFEKGKKNTAVYETPFGRLLLEISATEIAVTEREEKLSVRVNYIINANGQYLADSVINIQIFSR